MARCAFGSVSSLIVASLSGISVFNTTLIAGLARAKATCGMWLGIEDSTWDGSWVHSPCSRVVTANGAQDCWTDHD